MQSVQPVSFDNRHVVAYLDETEKLKSFAGPKFSDYSIGFYRYEISHEHQQRMSFEHQYPGIHGVDNNSRYVEAKLPHQAVFMATREQLLAWKERCAFDIANPPEFPTKLNRHREFVSSLRLFKQDLDPTRYFGCQVQQMIPLDSFEDFMVHHMSNRYCCDIPNQIFSSLDMQETRMGIAEDNKDQKMWVDSDGNYNGIRMELDENWEYLKRLEDHASWFMALNEYKDYVRRGGEFIV